MHTTAGIPCNAFEAAVQTEEATPVLLTEMAQD